ncbi:MAG TPA: AAA family ATPase [Clostridiales bacterium]|nr:AAA family ATPase [Clostridiales bacterium]
MQIKSKDAVILENLERGLITPVQATIELYELHNTPFGPALKQNNEQDSLIKAKEELNSLIGLDNVKKLIYEIEAYIAIQQKRTLVNLSANNLTLHMIFKGNPGTGKTTIARILSNMFKGMGVLTKGHLVEVERADLVGEYIGHTAQKVREQIKRAMGGILFIDEAYSLARGGEKDFGKEAIDTLVKSMEDYKDSFILILAGYRDEMEHFLRTNPGLRSRFPIHIEFKDYTKDQLMDIAQLMVEKKQYKLSQGARRKLYTILTKSFSTMENTTGNARLVRNIIERAIRKQAVRLVNKKNITRDELIYLLEEDFREET